MSCRADQTDQHEARGLLRRGLNLVTEHKEKDGGPPTEESSADILE